MVGLGLLLCAPLGAQTAGGGQTATVKVGHFTKPAVATVTRIESGDVACYLTLKDDQGKTTQEMADFDLCEKPKAFLNRRVNLTYTLDKVMADSCQGDPACKKTQTVALVTALTALQAASAAQTSAAAGPIEASGGAAKSQTSFCTPVETVVFACRTGAKLVSVCASKNATAQRGYLQYRFGRPDSSEPLELMWPEGEVPAAKAASGRNEPFAGGGGSWLRFQKGGFGYVVYSGIGKWGPKSETIEKQGVVVERGGKPIASLKCSGPLQSELSPDWFERSGVKAKDTDEFDFPD